MLFAEHGCIPMSRAEDAVSIHLRMNMQSSCWSFSLVSAAQVHFASLIGIAAARSPSRVPSDPKYGRVQQHAQRASSQLATGHIAHT